MEFKVKKEDPIHDTLATGDTDAERSEQTKEALWNVAGVLYRWRRFIIGMTGLMAVLAVTISLLLPNWYAASSRLLAPESAGTSPLAAALSSNLSAAASALLGGPNGDYMRYISILSSRTVYESVVDRFDLVSVYETQESETPRADAVGALSDNVTFPIDDEYDYLSVVVLDKDAQRAAEMANYFVQELNRRNMALASQDAANYRRFVELRYNEAVVKLDSLKDTMQQFQEEFGVFNLEQQAASFLEQLATMRAETFALEIEYGALREQYGPDNARVQAAGNALALARRTTEQALDGNEDVFPVPRAEFPEVMRTFVELEQELLIQKSIMELVAPMLENARFQEEREYEAVQVVDPAVAPTKKAKPRRSVIVIAATLSAFLLLAFFVLAFEWWQKNAAAMFQRLQRAAEG